MANRFRTYADFWPFYLREHAKTIGGQFADYTAAFVIAKDEVHPSPEGYALMRPIAEAAIRKA